MQLSNVHQLFEQKILENGHTIACNGVWLHISALVGVADEYPTRVGPNTIAKFGTFILQAALSATL